MGARIRQPCKSPECITRKWRFPRHAFFTFRPVGVRRQPRARTQMLARPDEPVGFFSDQRFKCRRSRRVLYVDAQTAEPSSVQDSKRAELPTARRSHHEYRHCSVAAHCEPMAMACHRGNPADHRCHRFRWTPTVALRHLSSGLFLTGTGSSAT